MKQQRKNKKSSFSTKEVSFLVIATCVLSFTISMLIFEHKDKNVKYVEDSNISLFLEQYDYIVNNYYYKVDKEDLIQGAIMGMLYSLGDPYAEYYDELSANMFNAKLNGYFEGAGIEFVKPAGGKVYVIDVFEGSNAYNAGVKIGDIIIEVDNKDVTTISNEEFITMVKNINRKFKIKVIRKQEELTFEIEKSKISLKSVDYNVLESDYGYIKIDVFALNTYEQFKNALEQLSLKNIKGLIIDLRNNPGGHLTTAEDILSLMINKDKVIYQIKNKNNIQKYYSKGSVDYNLPIIVLINDESASASELVTAALMEQLDACAIGQNTYGKGTVQELVDLPSGKQYKVTTKEWLTSLGKELEGKGVAPTIEISETDDDSFIKKAIEELKKNNT